MEYSEYKRLYSIILDIKDIAVSNQNYEMAAKIRGLEVEFFYKKSTTSMSVYNDDGNDDFSLEFFLEHVNKIKDKFIIREIKLRFLGL